MKKTLQRFCSILSIVSLMISAIPSEASTVDPYKTMVDMFETAEVEADEFAAAKARNAKFDPNTGYAFVSFYPYESQSDAYWVFKFKYSHLHGGFSFKDIETGKYLSGDSYIFCGEIRNLKDTECFFEILPCTEETIENEGIVRNYTTSTHDGFVYLKEIGRDGPPLDVRYRIILVNDPKDCCYKVPCDKHVKICAFDGKQILFLWINRKNELDSLYECYDLDTSVIEPKKRYFPDAREDEYFLAADQVISSIASGRIVRSEKFSNLNHVFTFISDDGKKFEIIFDEMGGQLHKPPTPGKLDVSGFKDN